MINDQTVVFNKQKFFTIKNFKQATVWAKSHYNKYAQINITVQALMIFIGILMYIFGKLSVMYILLLTIPIITPQIISIPLIDLYLFILQRQQYKCILWLENINQPHLFGQISRPNKYNVM